MYSAVVICTKKNKILKSQDSLVSDTPILQTKNMMLLRQLDSLSPNDSDLKLLLKYANLIEYTRDN
jgi:hypothetical protein